MKTIDGLLENNRLWAESMRKQDPSFFQELEKQQAPPYLWIGCADSRVPANQIIGLLPGEVFVHRNIANVVANTDLNCLSVIQYAVEILKVKHVIVCGHYGCGGVAAALGNKPLGLIDNWLREIKDVYDKSDLPSLEDLSPSERVDRLCELNVAAQVANVSHTASVQAAWKNGQELSIHGWVYSLGDGLIRDLTLSITSAEQTKPIYRMG